MTDIDSKKAYHGVVYIILSSIILGVVWGFVRWQWLTHVFWPNAGFGAKIFLIALFVVVHLIVCRHWIFSIRDDVEKYVWWGMPILTFFFFFAISNYVEKKNASCAVVANLSVGNEQHLFGKTDYIKVNSIEDSLLYVPQRHFDVSFHTEEDRHGRNIVLVYTEIKLLSLDWRVFVCYQRESTHKDNFASKDEINKWAREQVKLHATSPSSLITDGVILRHIKAKEERQPYVNAIRKTTQDLSYYVGMPEDEYIVYEVTDSKTFDLGEKETMGIPFLLILETLLLLFVFSMFFVREEYAQSVEASRAFMDRLRILRSEGLLRHIDTLLLYSPMVVMVLMFLVLLFDGFSFNSDNIDLLVKWGALDKTLTLEQHEWWRLLTYGFLHAGPIHLIGNLFCGVVCLTLLNALYRGRFLFGVFMASMVLSGVSILLFSTASVTVGASGGVFAMLAFCVVTAIATKATSFAIWPGVMIVINLLNSFGNGISMSGHLGGLAAGVLLGVLTTILHLGRMKDEEA